jgi:hypothetical protein
LVGIRNSGPFFKKRDRNLRSGEFLAGKRQEIAIPPVSWKKTERNCEFLPVPGKKLGGNWISYRFFSGNSSGLQIPLWTFVWT